MAGPQPNFASTFDQPAIPMSAQRATAQHTRPIQRLALHSTVTCSAQATVYGKCIVATYTDVKKDICREEFAIFKECIHKAMKQKR